MTNQQTMTERDKEDVLFFAPMILMSLAFSILGTAFFLYMAYLGWKNGWDNMTAAGLVTALLYTLYVAAIYGSSESLASLKVIIDHYRPRH